MIFDKRSDRLQSTGSRASGGLPIWPVLGVFVVAAACLGSGRYFAWSADLLGLLTAISITQTAAVGLRKLPFTIHPPIRWLLLALAAILAMLAAVYLQQIFWPATQTQHSQWLLPVATAIFILWSVLPEEIDIEAARRATSALNTEQEKHNTERRILEARLAALQGQIEPHFLYNTL
ncbi:MAG TPA: histidine kinase, partial [Burkholderiaceae bacterium]|nr:histidine kinase [Burkholderiaceae bacterium]